MLLLKITTQVKIEVSIRIFMKQYLKERLEGKMASCLPIVEKHGSKIISCGIGVGISAVDLVALEGKPILTIGLPLLEMSKLSFVLDKEFLLYNAGVKEGGKNYLKGLASYSLGAGVLFGISYSSEIINYFENLY